MKRRDFVKSAALVPAAGALIATSRMSEAAISKGAALSGTAVDPASAGRGAGAPGAGKVPDFAGNILDSDMSGLGSDGKPTGQKMTFTGASKANTSVEEAMRHKSITSTLIYTRVDDARLRAAVGA